MSCLRSDLSLLFLFVVDDASFFRLCFPIDALIPRAWNTPCHCSTGLPGRCGAVNVCPSIRNIQALCTNHEPSRQFFFLWRPSHLVYRPYCCSPPEPSSGISRLYTSDQSGKSSRVKETATTLSVSAFLSIWFRFPHYRAAMISFHLHVQKSIYGSQSFSLAFYAPDVAQAVVGRKWHNGIRLLTTQWLTYTRL